MKKRDHPEADQGRKSEAAVGRAARQAEALRANLRRRKEQARARRRGPREGTETGEDEG